MESMEEYAKMVCEKAEKDSQDKNNYRKNDLPDAFSGLREDGVICGGKSE
mgnify:CR=1 FL=1